jgi:hypothetical protein
MLGREIIESKQRLFVLCQALNCLRVFRLIALHEVLECLERLVLGGRHPDGVQIRLRLALQMLGQIVQHIAGLMHPTPLMTHLRVEFGQGFPEPQRTVADCELRHDQSTLFKVTQHATPGVG